MRSYSEEFNNYNGNMAEILKNISDWMIENNPQNPVLVIVCQTNFITIHVLYN